MKISAKATFLCIGLIILLSAASGCGSKADDADQGVYTSIEELSGKRIGIQMGAVLDQMTLDYVPDAKILYFNSFPDTVVALKSKKIDAFPVAWMAFSQYQAADDSLVQMEGDIGALPMAYVFPKDEHGKALRDQMNEFLSGLRASGELEKIEEMWSGTDESEKTMIDYTTLPDRNGRLTFLTEGSFPPYTYIRDNIIVGYDMDITTRFCQKYGYALDVVDMSFDALMPAVAAGKCDFAASGITITEERAKSVYFSEPNIYDKVAFVTLKKGADSGSFVQTAVESFRKTFIIENRYKLFLKGIAATLTITILSVIFGTLLGFGMYLLCRKGNKAVIKITSVFSWLIRGMPGVVLLMLLYYVVFGKLSISGLVVAVIAFSLTFATAMHGMLESGVKAVDPGQTKAAYALGFNDRSTFFHLILPQAAQHFMPAYKGEITALIKATAIVGYITVEDLTRMGDLIRSRTYEPFFPIISVAVIYFILAGILTAVANRLVRAVDPKKRTKDKILKGIEVHD